MTNIHDTIIQTVGKTPLVKINKLIPAAEFWPSWKAAIRWLPSRTALVWR
jgi:hypothetical protein